MDIQFGLRKAMAPRMLFVQPAEDGSGAAWYELDRSKNPPAKVWITDDALCGFLAGIRIRTVGTTRGPKDKFELLMNCGPAGSFTIRAGADTKFARSVVLALMTIATPDEMKAPLELAVKPGDQGKIVFASLRDIQTGRLIKYEWDPNLDLADVLGHLQSIIGDGGLQESEEHETEDAGGAHATTSTADGAGNANDAQHKELLRCGVLAGLAFEVGKPNESLTELNNHCGNIYKNADGSPKTIYQLTRDEAIEYRKTLLAM